MDALHAGLLRVRLVPIGSDGRHTQVVAEAAAAGRVQRICCEPGPRAGLLLRCVHGVGALKTVANGTTRQTVHRMAHREVVMLVRAQSCKVSRFSRGQRLAPLQLALRHHTALEGGWRHIGDSCRRFDP